MNCNQIIDRLNQLMNEEEKNELKVELGNEYTTFIADLSKVWLEKCIKYCADNMRIVFVLENSYGYGRTLAAWLIERDYIIKDGTPAKCISNK